VRLLLLDGNNVLVRAAEATRRAALSADGVPTAALLVFINVLSRHVRAERPDALVVCWDGGRSAYRTAVYPGYKAHRSERPAEDPERPFGLCKEFLSLCNLQHVERPGWEADDLIARYCQLHREHRLGPRDGEIVIISSDHDLLQLLGPGVTQVKVSSRPPDDRWDAERVQSDLGCTPALLPYSMALQGDPGDGVPGMRGVGPKKAVKLLEAASGDWGVLLDSLSPDNRELVELSHRLVDLRELDYGTLGLRLAMPQYFQPTLPGDAAFGLLLDFLNRYQLRSVIERVVAGTLWGSPAEVGDVV
jgi:DNA polymerase I